MANNAESSEPSADGGRPAPPAPHDVAAISVVPLSNLGRARAGAAFDAVVIGTSPTATVAASRPAPENTERVPDIAYPSGITTEGRQTADRNYWIRTGQPHLAKRKSL